MAPLSDNAGTIIARGETALVGTLDLSALRIVPKLQWFSVRKQGLAIVEMQRYGGSWESGVRLQLGLVSFPRL